MPVRKPSALIAAAATVILERNDDHSAAAAFSKNRVVKQITPLGVFMAFLGMIGQAIGYIISKVGMIHGAEMLDPVAATYIRVIAGTAGVVVVFSVLGWWPKVRAFRHDLKALAHTSATELEDPAGRCLSATRRRHAGPAGYDAHHSSRSSSPLPGPPASPWVPCRHHRSMYPPFVFTLTAATWRSILG